MTSQPRFWHTHLSMCRCVAIRGWAFSLILLASALGAAQEQATTVTFTLDFPNSDPSHYVVSISSNGAASYEGNGRLTPRPSGDGSTDPEPASRVEFTASQALVNRVFRLTKSAHYFSKEVDLKKSGLAFTGSKTLTYKDNQRSTQATYNYSTVPSVQELTRIFQNLSSTLEFGRRLEYDHRYQKLALDDDLKRMEDSARDGDLEEVTSVAAILQKIANDRSVINLVRARALRLLATPGAQ